MKKVNGLHLWNVTLFNGKGNILNILTVRPSQEDALKKARTFLRRKQRAYPGASPRDVTYHGTIDA